jgi:uncharacterized protein (TIGR02284 family)
MNNRSASLLNDLLKVARDGERFYRDAAARATVPELRGIFRQMAQVRQRLMDELAEQVSARGAKPTASRTLRGAASQAYADARASMNLYADDIFLGAVAAVEDRLLDRYERALDQAEAESVRQVLRRHLLTVRAAHQRMRTLREQGLAA